MVAIEEEEWRRVKWVKGVQYSVTERNYSSGGEHVVLYTNRNTNESVVQLKLT